MLRYAHMSQPSKTNPSRQQSIASEVSIQRYTLAISGSPHLQHHNILITCERHCAPAASCLRSSSDSGPLHQAADMPALFRRDFLERRCACPNRAAIHPASRKSSDRSLKTGLTTRPFEQSWFGTHSPHALWHSTRTNGQLATEWATRPRSTACAPDARSAHGAANCRQDRISSACTTEQP